MVVVKKRKGRTRAYTRRVELKTRTKARHKNGHAWANVLRDIVSREELVKWTV